MEAGHETNRVDARVAARRTRRLRAARDVHPLRQTPARARDRSGNETPAELANLLSAFMDD
jgi:hypothetical protein